jgi:tetraacyldisaccharide 4'-kinase
VKRVDFAERHLLNRSIISYLLYPVSLIYAGFLHIRRNLLKGKAYRAPYTVISVGNLTSGGNGKSPIAIALCKALHKKGICVAYASRGYKSLLEHGASMVADGKNLLFPPQAAGDEAAMAHEMMPGIPIFSGRKRKEVLQLAKRQLPGLELMILDDAMQHLKVARDLDLVVFDTQIGLGNGFVIPAGYLRESLSAITRHSLCLLHQKPGAPENPELEGILAQRGAGLFKVRSSVGRILREGEEMDVEELTGKSIALVSAIARPQSFAESAKAKGIKYSKHHIFPDHHAFADEASIQKLQAEPAEYLLCSAKDAVKLRPIFAGRLLVLEMRTELPEAVIQRVVKTIDRH